MPYRVVWRDDAAQDLRSLPPMEIVEVRRLVGGFPHDRWLEGRSLELGGEQLRMLEADNLVLVYRIEEAERSVEIFGIFRRA